MQTAHRRIVSLVSCFVASIAPSLLAQQPAPVGGEFQVNTNTAHNQGPVPKASMAPDGTWLAVWGTLYLGIKAQRYAPDGSPNGSEFYVTSSSLAAYPAVAADGDGGFVVAWYTQTIPGGDPEGIRARRYASDGTPAADAFQVNTYTVSARGWWHHPSVAMNAAGGFVVVWDNLGSGGSDSSDTSIQARRYDSAGAALSDQFQVNDLTPNAQAYASVAMHTDGGFVVAWASEGSNGNDLDYLSVQARRYGSDGSPSGGQFQVNTHTTHDQSHPVVAVDPTGSLVIAWEDWGPVGSDLDYSSSVRALRYASDGSPVGSEFQANTYVVSDQVWPSVAVSSRGDLAVVWESWGPGDGTDTDGRSVHGQLFYSDGRPMGDQFQINTYTTNGQIHPSVAMDAAGDFVVVWTSFGSAGTDTDSGSVQGQRYATPIFEDGFESGDTAAWSTVVP